MKTLPRITVITPSYNQGKFIDETIKSVLSQNYPDLEFIIMDGGSTDETVEVLQQYEKILKKSPQKRKSKVTFIWKSEKDRGQTDAINKGLKIATGDILAYLNSDDTYEPNTLLTIAKYFQEHPETQFLYGRGKLIDLNGKDIGMYNDFPVNTEKLHQSCGISQPTAFWTRAAFKKVGYFDSSFQYTMDYEYWVRVSKYFPMVYLHAVLANTRIHPNAKTSSQTQKLYGDAIRVQKKYFPYVHHDWIFTYTDGFVHKLKNASWLQELYYWLYLYGVSFWLQLSWNKKLPTLAMRKQYVLWLKEIKNRFSERIKNNGKLKT